MRASKYAILLTFLAASAPVGATNLLTNGGFEDAPVGVALLPNHYAPNGMVQQYPVVVSSQYLSGWTIATPEESNLQRAPYANYSAYPTNAYEGSQFFSLNWSPRGSVVLDNMISQNFVLGADSRVKFSTAMTTETGYAGSTLQVSIRNSANTIVSQSALLTNTKGNAVWDLKSWDFDLAAGSYSIELHGIGADNAWDVILDDVRLDAVSGAVPEPATWAMMLFGFGMIGGAMRKRVVETKTVRA